MGDAYVAYAAMTRTLTFAIVGSGDIHVFLDHDMPPADNLVTVEVVTAHPELLIIRAAVAGPLRHLLGTGQIPPAPRARDTRRLEAALKIAEQLVDAIRKEIDDDIDDEGFQL